MVPDLDPGDLLLGAVGDRTEAVGSAPGHEAEVAVPAVRRPVGLLARMDEPVAKGRAGDDRRIVVHRAGDAELGPGSIHGDAMVRGVEYVLLPRHVGHEV